MNAISLLATRPRQSPRRRPQERDRTLATLEKSRTEALSDGVFAVAITLLAVGLHVPDPHAGGTLMQKLLEQWPSYLAYVLSFLTVGVIWINHHALLRKYCAVDHDVLILNVLLLMTIAAIPFSTELLAEYLDATDGANFAAFIYAATFLVMATWYYALRCHLAATSCADTDDRASVHRHGLLRLTPFAAATVAAFVSPYLTVGICFLIAIYYALPSTTREDNTATDETVGRTNSTGRSRP